MVADKGTAEEQLLKLIEGGPAKTSAQRLKRENPLGWIRGRLGHSSHTWRKESSDSLLSRLYAGNRLLTAVIIFLTGYLIWDVATLRQARHPSSGVRVSSGSPAQAGTPVKPDDYLRPMSVYIQSASRRNPFTEAGTPLIEAITKPKVDEQRVKTAAQGLTVVGIDRSGTPRALIEDAAQHRTFFVRVGEEINGLTVKSISSSGVVLTHEGDEVELPY